MKDPTESMPETEVEVAVALGRDFRMRWGRIQSDYPLEADQ